MPIDDDYEYQERVAILIEGGMSEWQAKKQAGLEIKKRLEHDEKRRSHKSELEK